MLFNTHPQLVKNKEIKVRLYDKFNIVPENPVEFLRYVVFIITNNTILVKNKVLIEAIKNTEKGNHIIKLFNKYEILYGLEKLSEIFYRFKIIFLAIRHIKTSNKEEY